MALLPFSLFSLGFVVAAHKLNNLAITHMLRVAVVVVLDSVKGLVNDFVGLLNPTARRLSRALIA